MNIHCKIDGEPCQLTASLQKDGSSELVKYNLSRNGQQVATVLRYPDGKYACDGNSQLKDEEVQAIGDAIDHITDVDISGI